VEAVVGSILESQPTRTVALFSTVSPGQFSLVKVGQFWLAATAKRGWPEWRETVAGFRRIGWPVCPGIGGRFGAENALIVGYYEGAKLYYVAKVRNGFLPQLRQEVYRKLKGLEIDACPFANLPEKKRTQWALTTEEMKNCRWLRPELVAQVEFTEWTPDGYLRHSKFVSLRDDKNPRDIVREG